KKDAKLISITSGDVYIRANYQDFQRFTEVDIAMAADAQATLPYLIEAAKQASPADRRSTLAERGEALRNQRTQVPYRSRTDGALAWDATPISTSRLCAEIWNQIKNEDWSLVSRESGVSTWPRRLWDMSKPYHYIGGPGGQGVGYTLPAAVGAALA